MLATLLSSLLLVNPSVQVLLDHHLETAEGRTAFLTEKLTPYVLHVEELNHEITALSEQVSQAEELNDETLALAAQVTEKMAVMQEMLPVLQAAQKINDDLAQIEPLFEADPLTVAQQEVADRLASLCTALD